MINKSDIVCIDVLYNPDDQVVSNVQKYNGLVNRTILVDNSDTDNSTLFSEMPNVVYIPLKKNTGIAHATNVGIKETTEPYILTMDQDSTISPSLIDAFLDYLNQGNVPKEIGALTPKYNTDRNPAVASEGTDEITFTMQSGTLFKREVFDKIGYLEEDLFIDVVDYEYFLRMNKNGYKILRINSAVLDHQPATTKVLNLGFYKLKYGIASPVRYYYRARNLSKVAKEYHSSKLRLKMLVLWAKILLLFPNKAEYFKLFNQGLKDAKLNKFGKYEID